MALEVIAMPRAEFDGWLSKAGAAAGAEPASDSARAASSFSPPDAARCHAVAGTEASGHDRPGPHPLGSRRSVGVDTLPHDARTTSRASSPTASSIKPGNLMPPFASSAPPSSMRLPPISGAAMNETSATASGRRRRLSQPAAAAEGRAREAQGGMGAAEGLAHPHRRQQHGDRLLLHRRPRSCSSCWPASSRC